jgi:hypothetical protein
MVVNGVLCDGENEAGGKQGDRDPLRRGWHYLPPQLSSLGGCQVDATAAGGINHLRVFPRALLTTEAIGSWRAGPPATVVAGGV